MGESLLFGLVASCSLPLGAFLGGHVQIPKRVLAAMLAFAAGALITALAFELFADSYSDARTAPAANEQGGPTVALSTAAGFVLSFYLATI